MELTIIGAGAIGGTIGAHMIRAGHERTWAPAALGRAVAEGLAVRCVDVAGLSWAEIDFVEDALFAKYEVWPAVRPGSQRRSAVARVAGGVVGAGRGLCRSIAALGGMFDGMM